MQVLGPHHLLDLLNGVRSWQSDGQPLGQPLIHTLSLLTYGFTLSLVVE